MKVSGNRKGFTLIEVIITIIIAALAGLVAFTFLGNMVTRSAEPIFMVQDLNTALDTMEAISAAYKEYLEGDITWQEFLTDLGDYPVSAANVAGTLGTDFDAIQVTVSTDQQSLCALFTE